MIMAFTWKEVYNTGFREMDEQHQELFHVGHELYEVLLHEKEKKEREESDIQRIDELICRLKKCSSSHFHFEEAVMEAIKYENFEKHKEEHKIFNQMMDDFEEVLHHDERRLYIEKILLFMTDWLSKHSVNSEDKQVVRYMKHKNIDMKQLVKELEERK